MSGGPGRGGQVRQRDEVFLARTVCVDLVRPSVGLNTHMTRAEQILV